MSLSSRSSLAELSVCGFSVTAPVRPCVVAVAVCQYARARSPPPSRLYYTPLSRDTTARALSTRPIVYATLDATCETERGE